MWLSASLLVKWWCWWRRLGSNPPTYNTKLQFTKLTYKQQQQQQQKQQNTIIESNLIVKTKRKCLKIVNRINSQQWNNTFFDPIIKSVHDAPACIYNGLKCIYVCIHIRTLLFPFWMRFKSFVLSIAFFVYRIK